MSKFFKTGDDSTGKCDECDRAWQVIDEGQCYDPSAYPAVSGRCDHEHFPRMIGVPCWAQVVDTSTFVWVQVFSH